MGCKRERGMGMPDTNRISKNSGMMTQPFNASAPDFSIWYKFKEIVENTIFEVIQIAGCSSIQELKSKDYELTMDTKGTKATIALRNSERHIITYIVYYDYEEKKIKRDRLVNDLESEDDV